MKGMEKGSPVLPGTPFDRSGAVMRPEQETSE